MSLTLLQDHIVYPMIKMWMPLAAALLLGVPSQAAGNFALEPGTLTVGSTGIYCVRTPCPWRGIVGSDGGLLWSGNELPVIKADAADKESIVQAWDGHHCVLVDGDFDGTTLLVRQILGDCS